jgi:glycosyltransferase involved in cell wall biosynthesis
VFHYGSRTFQEQKIDHTQWMLGNEKIFYQRTANFSIQAPHRHRSPRSSAWKPLIAIIVRTKDRPHPLRRALNSLANQTFQDFEVILVNDGLEKLDDFLGDYSPYLDIQYISFPESIGRAAALNAGLKQARADWIGYLDDDDILYPIHLDLLAAQIIKHNTPAVFYTDANKALCWSEKEQRDLIIVDRVRFAPQIEFSLDELLVDNWIPIMSYLHPRSLADEIGGYNENLGIFEDWDFLIRLASRVPFYHIARPTCEYRFRFGDQFDDSTLQQRENAVKYRSTVYEIYSARNDKIATKRRETMVAVARQIEDVERIMELHLTSLQRSFLIAARLGGFSLPKDLRSK